MPLTRSDLPSSTVVWPDLTPWVEALSDHDLPALKALIAASPHPLPVMKGLSDTTSTPLLQAITEGWLAGFQALLPVSDPNQADGFGDPPLSVALSFLTSTKNARAMVKALAPLVDVNRLDSNQVHPLELAIEKGDAALLTTLLKHGAPATTLTRSGGTLLHALIDLDEDNLRPLAFAQLWAVLVAHGTDPGQANGRGLSAWAALDAQPAARQQAIRQALVRQETEQLTRAMGTPNGVEQDAATGTPVDARRARSRL